MSMSVLSWLFQRVYTLLAVAALVWLLTSSPVSNAQEFPELTGRIVDLAELLDASTESSLSQELAAHETQTGNQIVVVTIPDLDGFEIADYANRLARYWGIGSASEDNGVVLVVAHHDRKVRIEVGYGLEGALTDALSSIIIQREILPEFRNNDYSQGIQKGIDAIQQAIVGEYINDRPTTDRKTDLVSDKIGGLIPLIFIAMVAIPELLRRAGLQRAARGAFPAGFAGLFATLTSGSLVVGLSVAIAIFLLMFFNGVGGGGSGGTGRRGGYIGTGGFGGGMGGGGFSGGGGSFGGGGASGSW